MVQTRLGRTRRWIGSVRQRRRAPASGSYSLGLPRRSWSDALTTAATATSCSRAALTALPVPGAKAATARVAPRAEQAARPAARPARRIRAAPEARPPAARAAFRRAAAEASPPAAAEAPLPASSGGGPATGGSGGTPGAAANGAGGAVAGSAARRRLTPAGSTRGAERPPEDTATLAHDARPWARAVRRRRRRSPGRPCPRRRDGSDGASVRSGRGPHRFVPRPAPRRGRRGLRPPRGDGDPRARHDPHRRAGGTFRGGRRRTAPALPRRADGRVVGGRRGRLHHRRGGRRNPLRPPRAADSS